MTLIDHERHKWDNDVKNIKLMIIRIRRCEDEQKKKKEKKEIDKDSNPGHRHLCHEC